VLLRRAAAAPVEARLRFVLVERDVETHARLQAAVAAHQGHAAHAGRTHAVDVVRGSFEVSAAALLRGPWRPTFSFVDPYGCDGVQFTTIVALAERGEVVWHFAASALYTKLIATTGESEREGRRMDRFLGGSSSWAELRAQAREGSAREQKERLVQLVVRGLAGRGLRATAHALREGESYLVRAAAA
jgi:three-Cys-motif partner protein